MQASNLTIALPVSVPDQPPAPVFAFPVPAPDQTAPAFAAAVAAPVVARLAVPETLSGASTSAQDILPDPPSLPQTELPLTFFTGPLPGVAIPLETRVLTPIPALDGGAASAAVPFARSDVRAGPAPVIITEMIVPAAVAPVVDVRAQPRSSAERPELTPSPVPAASPQARLPATLATVPGPRVADQRPAARVASAPVRPAPLAVSRAPVSPSPSAAVAASAATSVPPPSSRAPAAQPVREVASAPPATRPVPALAGIPRAGVPASAPGAAADAVTQLDIRSQLLTRIDGKAAGRLDFQQTASGLLVRLGSLADVLSDRLDPAIVARIRSSSSANLYLPLARLQADGIPISYDPVYDEFNIGLVDTRPKAAAKVHMDQISAPERGLGSVSMGQVPRKR